MPIGGWGGGLVVMREVAARAGAGAGAAQARRLGELRWTDRAGR